MTRPDLEIDEIVAAIRRSGLSIYDPLGDHPNLVIPDQILEAILDRGLRGLVLNQPIRTRSKVLKTAVCAALGYGAPRSFRKTQPRFIGQNFDTYVQKSDNLQIFNEGVALDRRYVLIRLDGDSIVTRVRVVTGAVIDGFRATGTLTLKFQAKARTSASASRLVSTSDTPRTVPLVLAGKILPIAEVYSRLKALVGTTFADPGNDRERTRGDLLHEKVAQLLGTDATDNRAQFPDILEQLLEVKLQTSPTIDLGLWSPDSEEPMVAYPTLHHEDARFAVFYGSRSTGRITIEHLIVTTGHDFFTYFRRFEGLGVNAKRQIPLPRDFFR